MGRFQTGSRWLRYLASNGNFVTQTCLHIGIRYMYLYIVLRNHILYYFSESCTYLRSLHIWFSRALSWSGNTDNCWRCILWDGLRAMLSYCKLLLVENSYSMPSSFRIGDMYLWTSFIVITSGQNGIISACKFRKDCSEEVNHNMISRDNEY